MKSTTSCKRSLIPLGATLFAACAAFSDLHAQSVADLNGNYPVTESWSVTLQVGTGRGIATKTYSGNETGTLTISNGTYTLINHTGATSLGRLGANRTIYYDGSNYSIEGSDLGIAGGPGGFYVVFPFTFFAIKVPLGSQGGFSAGDPSGSTVFSSSGGSLDDLAGSGSYLDVNAALQPDTTAGYLNQANYSSVAGLVFPPVAPSITTLPVSQNVVAGSDVSFSVGASGTPPPTYEWKHNGTKIADGGEFSGTATPKLSINNAQAKDSGSYTVVVSNSKGSSSASATLTVESAQSLTNLYSFTGGGDGASPNSLTLAGATLYGTAAHGGISSNGTVYAVHIGGTGFTLLHGFTNGDDGAHSEAGAILSGNTLYGTASKGGTSGYGTVFAVNTDGTGFTTLHSFTNGDDGGVPGAGLILSGATLYGTASEGGASGAGTVFAVNTDGTQFATLYSFTGGNDGAGPQAGLVLSGSTLYGTATGGGSSGNGTVFAVNTDGTGFTTLHSFTALDAATQTTNDDGAYPYAALVLSGNTLYGTANGGGTSGNGTVFAVNTDGTHFTTLRSFSATDSNGLNSDGAYPGTGMTLAGNTLYGTASSGGSSGNGTVFAVSTDGAGFTVLYSFAGGSDGAYPQAELLLSGNTLYGTTAGGGSAGYGTVFSLALASSSAQQGSLQVTIAPSGAVNGGAQWKVDSNPFQNSGSLATGLSVGEHEVSFSTIAGWTTPVSQTVAIKNGATTKATGVYTQQAKGNPKLSITSPKSAQVLSSAALLVSGMATDRVAVENVYYQLNAGAWTLATAGNAWSNWTASVTLSPGINTVSAYAVDASGTFSTTNKIVINYNPLLPEQGTFSGLFLDTNDVTEASAGFFTLTLSTSGGFTGKIITSGGTYSLPTTKAFDLGGHAQFTVAAKQGTLAFNLQLDLANPPSQQITGTVSDGAWMAELTADRAVFSATTNKAVNYEGLYTMAITGSGDPVASPGGFGYATLSVSPAGLITMAGSLADGTAMSQSVSVSKEGRWPFYAAYPAPPAGNGGAVFGWLSFSNQPATALAGTLYWFRPAGKTPAVYQGGFTNLAAPVTGSAYNPAAKPLLALPNGRVTLDGGNLPFTITNHITLSPSGAITVAPDNTNNLALTINKTTGVISGSFGNPSNSKQSIKVSGVLLQNQTNAVGYFLGTSHSGAFLLENP